MGAWAAGHVAKAIACELAAAKAVLGPHLEMEPGPACRTGWREEEWGGQLPAYGSPPSPNTHWRLRPVPFGLWLLLQSFLSGAPFPDPIPKQHQRDLHAYSQNLPWLPSALSIKSNLFNIQGPSDMASAGVCLWPL
jgi:hypothetical protein